MENTQDQFALVLKENPIAPSEAQALESVFGPMLKQVQVWKSMAESIKVISPDQIEDMQQARKLRLLLKDTRVEADKKRKEMKEESLRKGKAVDGMFNIIKFLIVPLEEKLQKDEDFIHEMEEKRMDEMEEKRKQELSVLEVDCSWYKLREMAEETYQALLINAKKDFEAKKESERKDEEDRIRKEKEDRERREATEKENAKLKAEAEARKKEEAEKEARHNAELEAERKEKKKLEDELQKKAEAERKKKTEEERRKKEEAEKMRKEAEEKAKAPDREKLKDLEIRLAAIQMPDCQTEEGKAVVEGVNKLMLKVTKYIRENTLNL